MNRQEIDFDHVYDFIGFRITTKTVRECYEALGIVHNLWKPVPGRFKDYIAMRRRTSTSRSTRRSSDRIRR